MQKNTYNKINKKWDYIIITANNYRQKELAEKEILKRKKIGYIAKGTKVIIRVAPKGIETGAMLLKVIKKLNLKGKKALYIPSAGKAQRTLYYFKKGKLWIKTKGILKNGEERTIFDEILLNTKPILEKMQEGILICCSDVVLEFDNEINIQEKEKVYVFSNIVKANLGTKHGAFKIKENKVEEVLQKASLEVLEKEGFIKEGNVNIDTGMLIIPDNILKTLKKVKIKNKKMGIYENLIPKFCEEKVLNAVTLSNSKFIHYGSSKEIIDLKGDKNNNYFENSCYNYKELPKNVMVFNSEINQKIPDNVIIYTTQIKNNKWVTVIYGIEDDIKAKGKYIKIFGKDFKIDDNSQMSLWNLKIYKPEDTKREAIDSALKLYYLLKNDKTIDSKNTMSIEQILKKENLK